MKTNVGNSDKTIRFFAAAILLIATFLGAITGVWATVAIVAAVILGATSLFGVCPIYSLLGMNTCSRA